MATLTVSQILAANSDVPDAGPNASQECNVLDEYDEKFHLVIENTDIPLANARYRILASSGESFEGRTDSQGFTERVRTRTAATLTVEIFDEGSGDVSAS